MKVFLFRGPSTNEGTFGTLRAGDFTCLTAELPWRNNQRGLSCIPAGIYRVEWDKSPSHGMCYHVRNVPGRDHILIHSANLAGNVQEGFVSQVEGCIALGSDLVVFAGGTKPAGAKNQKGISSSRGTVLAFEALMGRDDFELVITEDA